LRKTTVLCTYSFTGDNENAGRDRVTVDED
jgi:hypothetical protein